jgi:hypothetical protein
MRGLPLGEQRTDKPDISIARQVCGQILTWFGIVGGALTLANHLSNFITLADWMHSLASDFSEITYGFWNCLAKLLGFSIPRSLSPLLSFIFFCTGITVGTKLNTKPNETKDALCGTSMASMFMEVMYSILLAVFFVAYSSASDHRNVWILLFAILFSASLINVVFWRVSSILSRKRTLNGYLEVMKLLVVIGCINVLLTINVAVIRKRIRRVGGIARNLLCHATHARYLRPI